MGYINVPGGSKIDIIKGEQFNSDQITLKTLANLDARVSADDYVFINENCNLVLDTPSLIVYDKTTPVQVISNNADISGNGGRKLVRLNNGWLVAIRFQANNIHLYKSDNNGSTWSLLVTRDMGSSTVVTDTCITTNGEIIYTTTAFTSGGMGIIGVHNYNILGSRVSYALIDNAINSTGNISSAIGSNGHIYIAYSSKTSTYPNSWNIRYSKSTDGGATWATPTQITSFNNTLYNYITPSIIVNNIGNPVIVMAYTQTNSNFIYARVFDGSNWSNDTAIPGIVPSYVQSKPSIDMLSDGALIVAWTALDTGYPSATNVRFSKSTNNGVTWSTVERLTNETVVGCESVSITRNASNVIFILYNYLLGGSDLKGLYYDGTWRSFTATAAGNPYPNPSLCNNFRDFEKPLSIYATTTDLKLYGKWSLLNSPQLIKSVVNAVTSADFKALGAGLLKSADTSAKIYDGFIAKTDLGFTKL